MCDKTDYCILRRQKQTIKPGTKTVWVNDGQVETKRITKQHYDNFIEACSFFRGLGGTERNTRDHTSKGYLVVRNISTNPDKTVRRLTTFDFRV